MFIIAYLTLVRTMWRTLHRNQRGEINIGTAMMFGVGIAFLSVGFLMLPTLLSATDAILAYEYSSNTSITDATFTGLTSITGLTPLLAVLGYVAVAVIAGFMGIKVSKGAANVYANPGAFLMLGLGLIFFAVGLYIFPVALDGVSGAVHNGGSGISSSYSGFSSVLLLTPMLLLLGYVAGTVILGFFGIKMSSRS